MKSKYVLCTYVCVSEGINLKFVLTKFWGDFLKPRVSEICVKRIRVNQGLGVYVLAPNQNFSHYM